MQNVTTIVNTRMREIHRETERKSKQLRDKIHTKEMVINRKNKKDVKKTQTKQG